MKGDFSFGELFHSFLPTAAVVVGAVAVGVVVRLILRRSLKGKPGVAYTRQVITMFLVFVAIIAVLVVLPIRDTLRGQLFTLFGIIISALIALSSSTIVSNAMAGFMLRSVKNFKPGDFLKVGEYVGRVSDRGLLHTEIQTINRDLVTIPNHYLVHNPVTVTRSSGTFISGDVSLGYDVPERKAEKLLIEAAEEAELGEPFVHILELGDFSVTYRLYGLLEDVKYLVSARSTLKKHMLDALHRGGIEIVSPHFMNQRALQEGRKFIPQERDGTKEKEQEDLEEQTKHAESLAFDKAEEAESIERLREKIGETDKEIEELKEKLKQEESGAGREKMKEKLTALEARKERLADLVEKKKQEQEREEKG